MRWVHRTVPCCLLLFLGLAGCGPSSQLPVAERRAAVDAMARETLDRLYGEAPYVKAAIAESPGYGVFSNANVNVIFVSAGGGYGVVVDRAGGRRTYMRMALGGVGLGVGVKDYRVVMVFKTRRALDRFVEKGWSIGAHADAAAKASDKGAEASVEGDFSDEVEVYSMTEAGLALQATVAGAKFWKDRDLN